MRQRLFLNQSNVILITPCDLVHEHWTALLTITWFLTGREV